MNILFVTLVGIRSVNDRGIYQDLLRKFRDEGHDVTIVTPMERRKRVDTNFQQQEGVSILQVKTLNVTKTNIIEKGIGTLVLEHQYLKAIKRFLFEKRFDLVLYSTPPITFSNIIRFIKKRDDAKSYLLLKDIFPQNAVDLGMMKNNGILHRFFRQKEKQLYRISDFIGCMSQANVDFLLKHNPEILAENVEVCPNSIEPVEFNVNKEDDFRVQYKIPENAALFVYGGNLGKPQGLDFLLEVLNFNNNKADRFFLIVGSGTEFSKVNDWFEHKKPSNAVLIKSLPKLEYDSLVSSCDVGLIFLDPRFTIPNYPSRLLSYLEYKMPVLMATDKHTDIGKIAEENGYGFWCENGDLESFNQHLDIFCDNKKRLKEMGETGYGYLKNNYTVSHSYRIIMNHF